MSEVVGRERVSKRLVRSFVRYLRDRVGEAAYDAAVHALPDGSSTLARQPQGAPDWIPLDTWLPILRAFEARFGQPDTLQLCREMTRSCMAVAVAKGWSAFLADITPHELLQRANTFWRLSYDTGTLRVAARGPRSCKLVVDGWLHAPAEVQASLSEACVVFLVRLDERNARAVESRNAGLMEIDVTW
jgi:hypothetical protein